jgi:hypothetical protein
MADKEPRQPTHRAYSIIKREGQDDFWLNIGLVFPHEDDGGFNIVLQAFPLDGKIVLDASDAWSQAAPPRLRPREAPFTESRKQILCGWMAAGLGRLSFHSSMEATNAICHLSDRCRDHRPHE